MKEQATDFLEVTEAKYVSGYKLLLTFNDGAVRLVDFGPFLDKARNPDTTDFRDLKKFKSFHIQEGDLMWGDYQMIFPIMDLYRGSILEREEVASSPFVLREAVASRETVFVKPAKVPAVSYRKSKAPTRRKR
ncbi:MAG: DUF2442 domain-containing protein [Pedosphaera parvula]|nr:DUF2442 domain-containing protein [Pedosphaera parvula]